MTTDLSKTPKLIRKYASTFAFVLLMIAQIVTFDRISNQQDEVGRLGIQNSDLIQQIEQLIAQNTETYCAEY